MARPDDSNQNPTDEPLEAFLAQVRSRAIWPNRAESTLQGTACTLAALGGALDPPTRRLVAAALPEALRRHVHVEPPHPAPADSDELIDLVARYERVPLGLGLDHALAVLQTVGRAIGPGGRAQIRGVAGEDIAELLEGRSVVARAERAASSPVAVS